MAKFQRDFAGRFVLGKRSFEGRLGKRQVPRNLLVIRAPELLFFGRMNVVYAGSVNRAEKIEVRFEFGALLEIINCFFGNPSFVCLGCIFFGGILFFFRCRVRSRGSDLLHFLLVFSFEIFL